MRSFSHAVRARKAGRRLVLLRGPAIVDRMLTLAGCSGDLEIGDIDQIESALAGLLQLVGRRARPMSAATVRDAAEMVPIEHETSEQVVRTLFFVLPPVALALGGWLAWGGTLHWQDLVVLRITYAFTGLGITVGYHRLFTHRSFKTTRTLRALLAVLGRWRSRVR